MNLAQALAFPAVSAPHHIGPIATARCAARACPDRSAPVFLARGIGGYHVLCGTCRDYQRRILLLNLPLIRRSREGAMR